MGLRKVDEEIGCDMPILDRDSFQRSKLFTFNPDYFSISPEDIDKLEDVCEDEVKVIDGYLTRSKR